MVCDGVLVEDIILKEGVALAWIDGSDFYLFRLIAKVNGIFYYKQEQRYHKP
jgi:hypothetical protein